MDGAAVGSSVLDLGRIRCRRLPVRAVPLSGEAVIIVVERADIKTGMKGFILIMFLLMCSAEWMMIISVLFLGLLLVGCVGVDVFANLRLDNHMYSYSL